MTSYLSHEVNTYTIEVSMLGYEDHDSRQIIPYTDDLYAKVGRNITRAFWDYYKIVAVIPLEDSSDDECGIPKPPRDLPGRPKSAAVTRSFNMDRLKEVERQRQQTAQTFDQEGESGRKTSEGKSRTTSVVASKPRRAGPKLSSGKGSVQFRKSFSFSSDNESLDNISQLCIKNESSGGENDYSSRTDGTNGTNGTNGRDKVLTPIVSLELDELPGSRAKNQNARDDVDFFFNENNNRGGTGKAGVVGLVRQDSKDSIDNYFKGSTQPASRFTSQDLFHPSRPRPGSRPSLQISGLGPARRDEEEVLLPQSVLSNPLGVKLVPHSGVVGPRKLGDPLEDGQVPLIQPLNPWVQETPSHQPTLHVIDFTKLTKHSSLPAFNATKKRKRKKAVAGLPVVEGPTITKEEYFNNI